MIRRRLGLAVPAVLVAAILAGGTGHAAPAKSGGAAAATNSNGAGSDSDVFTGFQANSKDPIQVDAKTLEIYNENKQRISVFSGNVVVTRGPTIMHATSMKLYSDLDSKDPKDPKDPKAAAA